MTHSTRDLLISIQRLLEATGPADSHSARAVEAALRGGGADLDAFLVSNELWGGAGSIVDQACSDNEQRRGELEEILIRLGRLQIDGRQVNPRTEMWVSSFEKWQRMGLRRRKR